MTTPRSPRGRKAKGDLGERQVRNLLQSVYGLKVLDGRMTEPGCDLILNPQAVVEVKNRPWRTIGGVERAALLGAAIYHRTGGVAHWLITHEDGGWQLSMIDRKADGRIGLVYRQAISTTDARKAPLPPGFPTALGLGATSAPPDPTTLD